MKWKILAVLLAALALLYGCEKQPEESSQASSYEAVSEEHPWSIISAKSGADDCLIMETKNYGGQQTGIYCRIYIPLDENSNKSSVSLSLELPGEAFISEEKSNCIVKIDGSKLVVDLTVENPHITMERFGNQRTYTLIAETEAQQ